MYVSVSQTARFYYPYIWRRHKPLILHNNPAHAAKPAEPAVGAVTVDQDKQDHSQIRMITSVMDLEVIIHN